MKKDFDSDLGELEFQDFEGDLSYSCEKVLPISEKKVHIFFKTNSFGILPSKLQKQFLQQIIENYDKILGSIELKIPDNLFGTLSEKPFGLREKYDLVTLGIPLNTINPKWDLSLVNKQDNATHLLSNFEGTTCIRVWKEIAPKRPLYLRILLKLIGR
ncbi:MAG: hypothetical protein JWP69_2433 [Flaviaesturariibacter sp.]|nr:hypothetical protein [Flaviaesturariibacter sp.]